MNRVVINGVTYESTGTISINNGNVIVGNDKVDVSNEKEVNIEAQHIEKVISKGSVNVLKGTVGSVDAGNSVKCGDVLGDVDAGNSVHCGKVKGNVDAGNSIHMKK